MRLFIGLQLDAQTRLRVADAVNAFAHKFTASLVPPELYHITLAYLGEREENSLPGLQALIARCAMEANPFTLPVTHFNHFGTANNAILYAAPAPCNALTVLCQALRHNLHLAGETFDEQAFTPHITVARKVNLTVDTHLLPLMNVSAGITALTLFHSTRTAGALCYNPIVNCPLNSIIGGAS